MKKLFLISILSLCLFGQSNKEKFYDLIVPKIDKVIEKHHDLIFSLTKENSKELLIRYKAKDLEELIYKLKVHPKSIIIAQAAIESGWGSSRFFKEGNNIFGVWSYNKNEPRIRTNKKRSDGKYRYIKKYSSLEESIEDYLNIIATVSVYKKFVSERNKSNNPYHLTKYLNKYCELGDKYVLKLNKFIKYNKLTQFDN